MTVELAFRFPLGRVHATPWGENINEGGVEWPPSPWRLLRALYATWRSRAPELDGDVVLRVLDELAEPPRYVVPEHAASHTRHYLPEPDHQPGVKTDKTKVLDAFVSLHPDDTLVMRWDADLNDEGRAVLARLAPLVTYLGRADSICDVTVSFELSSPIGQPLAPLADDDPTASIVLLTPSRPVAEDTLTVTTPHLRGKLRRREPPATIRLRYPVPAKGPWPIASTGAMRPVNAITCVRWSIASSARPSKYAAVAWCDTLRRAAHKKYAGLHDAKPSPTLSGKKPSGEPAETQHATAHWFAFGPRDERLLSTLVCWAPAGFDDDELDALSLVDRIYRKGIADVHTSVVGLEGWGSAEAVVPELAGPSATWVSYTPFAPPRHFHKQDGAFDDFVARSVARELTYRGFPEAEIEPFRGSDDWHRFRRYRPDKDQRNQARQAVGVKLHFADSITGPVALGALSHFGLGLFVPM